jgi:hypothetical protein
MTHTRQHLTHLESAGLVHLAQTRPEVEYLFRHALIQDAAYTVLLLNDRKRLHQAVGEALEKHYPDRLEELAPLLGHHFALAGQADQALHYFTQAGDTASRVYALSEAITHYSRAIAIARQSDHASSSQLRHLYSRRGNALYSAFQMEQAWQNFVEMAEVARQRQDATLQLHSLIERATIRALFNPMFQPADSIELSNQALALAEELDDREAQAKILWNLMRVHAVAGDSDQALVYGEQSLALARELGLSEQEAFTLNDMEHAYRGLGQIRRALDTLTEARRLWQAQNNLHMLATSLNRTAALRVLLGDFDNSLLLAEQARHLSQGSGNHIQTIFAALTLARIAAERGEASQALATLESIYAVPLLGSSLGRMTAVTIYQTYGAFEEALDRGWAALRAVQGTPQETLFGSRMASRLAYLLVQKGEIVAAESLLQRHKSDLKQKLKDLFGQGDEASFLAEAELGMARGHYQHVVGLIADLLPVFRSQGLRCYITEALRMQSRAWLALGHVEAAFAALTEARAAAEAIQQRRVLWQILASLTIVERQRGNEQAAQESADQARTVIAYLASHAPAALRTTFLALPQVQEVNRRML